MSLGELILGALGGKQEPYPGFEDIFARLIHQESRGNPNAVNPTTGASGLTQIMEATAKDPGFGISPLDWSKRFDADANKQFGSEYLKAMLGRYNGDYTRALAAYNWGPGNVDKWDGDLAKLPDETRNYVTKIMAGGTSEKSTEAGDPRRGMFATGGEVAMTKPKAEADGLLAKLFADEPTIARPVVGRTPEFLQLPPRQRTPFEAPKRDYWGPYQSLIESLRG